MNGRIYDPLLGRFLSADKYVQAPGSLQSYNRYSYVMNNPLTLTDPTGNSWWNPFSWFGPSPAEDDLNKQKVRPSNTGGEVDPQNPPKKDDDVVVLEKFVVTATRDKSDTALVAGSVATTVSRTLSGVSQREALRRARMHFVEMSVEIGSTAARMPLMIIAGLLTPTSGGNSDVDQLDIESGVCIPEDADPELVEAYYANVFSNPELAQRILNQINGDSIEQGPKITQVNSTRGWKVGDPINNLTAKGNIPSWSTVRQRFWKNEAHVKGNQYSALNVERMQKGLAPKQRNPETGQLESLELHHHPAQRDGGLFDVKIVTPDEHRAIDPNRK